MVLESNIKQNEIDSKRNKIWEQWTQRKKKKKNKK